MSIPWQLKLPCVQWFHCKPVINFAYRDIIFGSKDQKPSERFNERLIQVCECGQLQERKLKSRITLGIKNGRVQQKTQLAQGRGNLAHVREGQRAGTGDLENDPRRPISVRTTLEWQAALKTKVCVKCGYVDYKESSLSYRRQEIQAVRKPKHSARLCWPKKPSKRGPGQVKPQKVDRRENAETATFCILSCQGALRSVGSGKPNYRSKASRWFATMSRASCSVISLKEPKNIMCKAVKPSSALLSTFFRREKKAAAKVTYRKHGTVLRHSFLLHKDQCKPG